MIRLSDDDNKDIKKMFIILHKGTNENGEDLTFAPDEGNDKEFVWKMQRDVLQSGKPKWHPR